jgi:hypothetical protein
MRSTILVATLLALGSWAIGCYDPKITPGGLRCASGTKACPDGFVCSGAVCVTAGPATATGGAGTGGAGRGGAGAGGTGAGTGGAGGQCANPIAPLCQTTVTGPGSGCDPVCQTGCGCGLRCNVTMTGVACAPPAGAKLVGAICQPGADDCAPGLACLEESCGTNLGRCYRYCRDSQQCGTNGVCAMPVLRPDGTESGQRACALGPTTCDAIARTGCPDPALNCYVTGPNQTICDCPGGRNRAQGDTCDGYNDCAPGLWCLSVAGAPSRCYKLCRSTADCAGCMFQGSAASYCP